MSGHIRYDVNCPGCGRLLSGLTEDKRRARVLVHIRNCNGLKRAWADMTMTGDEAQARLAQAAEPKP